MRRAGHAPAGVPATLTGKSPKRRTPTGFCPTFTRCRSNGGGRARPRPSRVWSCVARSASRIEALEMQVPQVQGRAA